MTITTYEALFLLAGSATIMWALLELHHRRRYRAQTQRVIEQLDRMTERHRRENDVRAALQRQLDAIKAEQADSGGDQ